jgi:hypothetical protein
MAITEKRRKLMNSNSEVVSSYTSVMESLTSVLAESNFHEGRICLGEENVSIHSTKKEYIQSYSSYFRQPESISNNPKMKVYLISFDEIQNKINLSDLKYGHFQNNEISFLHNNGNGSLEFFDKKNLKFFIIFRANEQISNTISFFNWNSLKQILNSLNYVNIHGAVVGRNDTGIFLSNKGGSGKSSLMAYSIAKGMQTLGDDFLTVRRDNLENFYSVFRHFKLATTSPVINLARESFTEIGTYDNKQVFEISKDVGDIFRPTMKIKEIVIPFIGEQLRIHKISQDDAFKTLLPSTLMLNSATLATISTLRDVISRIPVVHLELSLNLQEAFELIDSRL